MKIAMVTATYPPYRGGMGNAAYYEAEALQKLGHDVTVFTPVYRGQTRVADVHDHGGPGVVRLKPVMEHGNAAFCPDLARRVRGMDLAILHYPFYGGAEVLLTGVAYGAWGKNARRPKLVVRYDMDVQGRGMLKVLFLLHEWFWLRRCGFPGTDRVIFSSFDYGRAGVGRRWIDRRPGVCVEIPYGVDPERFYPPAGVVKRSQLVFVGGLDKAHYFKGLDSLLEAIGPVLKADAGRALVVVGHGDRESEFRRLCAQGGISSQVQFMTNCPDGTLRDLYATSLATVLPSVDRSESFGLVLVESLACGTAVIASNLPGVRTVFEHEKTGFLVGKGLTANDSMPYTIDELRERLRWCFEHPDEMSAMGARGPAWVRDRYDWTAIVQKMLSGIGGAGG